MNTPDEITDEPIKEPMNVTKKEIKSILEKFPQASGVGFIVGPALLHMAKSKGLLGYEEALERWVDSNPHKSAVGDLKDFSEKGKYPNRTIVFIWDGPAIERIGDQYIVSIKETLANLE